MRKHLRALIAQLRTDLRHDTVRGTLVRSAGITVGLKIGATLIAFAASLLYARVLGPHGYGLYAYVIAWTTVLTIPVSLGLPQYLIREGAKAPHGLRWLLHWADSKILLPGIITAALMASAVFLPNAAGARWMFVIAAPLPLLNSLASVRSALLRAHGWVVRSQWPQLLAAPAAALIALTGLWMWRRELHPSELIIGMTASALLPLIINGHQLRHLPRELYSEPVPVKVIEATPFMLLGGLYLLNNRIDLIMLGSLKGASEAGVYAIASRIAELTAFFGIAANTTLAPRIAKLYNDNEHALLQRMLLGAARRYTFVTSILTAFIFITAPTLVYYLYGIKYLPSVIPLQILTVAYFIQVALGSAGTALTMTGHEKYCAYSMILAVCINTVLNAVLIPKYASIGASAATGASIAFAQGLLWRRAHKYLGLATCAFEKNKYK